MVPVAEMTLITRPQNRDAKSPGPRAAWVTMAAVGPSSPWGICKVECSLITFVEKC